MGRAWASAHKSLPGCLHDPDCTLANSKLCFVKQRKEVEENTTFLILTWWKMVKEVCKKKPQKTCVLIPADPTPREKSADDRHIEVTSYKRAPTTSRWLASRLASVWTSTPTDSSSIFNPISPLWSIFFNNFPGGKWRVFAKSLSPRVCLWV